MVRDLSEPEFVFTRFDLGQKLGPSFSCPIELQRAPEEMKLPVGFVLKLIKPLNGIQESVLHRYLTYLEHHLQNFDMKRSRCDTCVLIKRTEGRLDGVKLLQADDSLGFGDEKFLTREETTSKEFRCNPISAKEKNRFPSVVL